MGHGVDLRSRVIAKGRIRLIRVLVESQSQRRDRHGHRCSWRLTRAIWAPMSAMGGREQDNGEWGVGGDDAGG